MSSEPEAKVPPAQNAEPDAAPAAAAKPEAQGEPAAPEKPPAAPDAAVAAEKPEPEKQAPEKQAPADLPGNPGFFRSLVWFLSNKRTGWIQFVKYGGVGAFCTLLNVTVTIWLSATVLKCLTEADSHREFFVFSVDLPHVSADFPAWLRVIYLGINYTTGFLLSNIVCWLLDRVFVFRPGRHGALREMLYFIGVSAVSLCVGVSVQSALVYFADTSTWTAVGANILSALCINFAVRKLFIFKR